MVKQACSQVYFPRGCKSLMRGVISEALASRKVVYREVCTEGSEPAKSGTDEQKRNMRPDNPGEQPHSCDARSKKKGSSGRFRRDWRKG
jgi:hypothetical protein